MAEEDDHPRPRFEGGLQLKLPEAAPDFNLDQVT